ncbi:hypothetical protein HN873_070702 [Arachis hypogaea]
MKAEGTFFQALHLVVQYPLLRLCWCPDEQIAEASAKGDCLRVIKVAGEPSRPMRLPLPNGLLPKDSNHLYVTVADGSNHTYKIACSPRGWKEITLGRGWQRFYHENKLQPSNILLFKHKGRDDFSVRIFQSPGVERTYDMSCDDSGAVTPPRVPRKRKPATQAPRRRSGCINVPRSAAAAEVEQTFQSDHPLFIMHITKRLLGIHFLVMAFPLHDIYTCFIVEPLGPHYLFCSPAVPSIESELAANQPNVPHFGDDVNDDVMVTLRLGEISVWAVYRRYVGQRRRNCGSISQGWAEFLRKCNITVPKLAVFEISSTQPDVELLVQFVDFE